MEVGVFFQILAAALVSFLIWQMAKYLKWRRAVISFMRYETADFPRSTPREAAKSLKLIWNLTGKIVGGISREQRTKMLTEQIPIDHDAARILFALAATRGAVDKGEITEAEAEKRCEEELLRWTLMSKSP